MPAQGVLSLGDVETWLPGWTLEGRFCPLPPAKKMGKSVRPSSSTLKLGGEGLQVYQAGAPLGGQAYKGAVLSRGQWKVGTGRGMHGVGRPAWRGRCGWEAAGGAHRNRIVPAVSNTGPPYRPCPGRTGISDWHLGKFVRPQGEVRPAHKGLLSGWRGGSGRGQKGWAPGIWE